MRAGCSTSTPHTSCGRQGGSEAASESFALSLSQNSPPISGTAGERALKPDRSEGGDSSTTEDVQHVEIPLTSEQARKCSASERYSNCAP
jgi:hypothetical protein